MSQSGTVKNSMPTEAVIYTRVSSRRQLTEGHGNDAQERICRDYAAERGYKIIKVFQEPGISGATLDRPAMQELIAFLRSRRNKQTAVVFDDLKRFSRDVGGFWELEKLIKNCGAKLASPKHVFEDTPEGRFIQTMLVASGQLEREQNARQVVEKMKARIEAGYWPFPCKFPGYKTVKEKEHGKVLRRREPQATIIAEALDKFARGVLDNQVDVQHFLQQHKVNGGRVYLSFVRRILENSLLYAGWVEYKKWDVAARPGQHDALISLETHLKTKERLEGKVKTFARKDLAKDFPHRGFIVCSVCSKLMTASWSRGRGGQYPYYRCTEPTCPYYEKSINRDRKIEPEFQCLLTEVKPTEAALAFNKARMVRNWQKKMMVVVERTQDIRDEIKDTESRLELLVDKAEQAINVKAAQNYERKMEKLELYKAALEEKLEKYDPANFDFGTALNMVADFLSNPLKTWLSDDLRKQHRLLQMMFSRHLPYHPETGFGTPNFSLTYAALSGQPIPQVSSSGHDSKKLELLLYDEVKQFSEWVGPLDVASVPVLLTSEMEQVTSVQEEL